MSRRRPATGTVVVLTAIAAGGCTGSPDTAAFEILETRPATQTLAAADIYPTTSGRWTYRVVAGPGVNTEVAFRRARLGAFNATWIDEGEDDDATSRAEVWVVDGSGALALTSVIEEADGAITRFDPPLVVAPRELRPGEPLTQQVAMEVFHLDDPSRARESGTATQTIRFDEQVRLRTAHAELWTTRIVVTFKADLRLADAETTTTSYVVPGLGPLVRQEHNTVKAMGIRVRNRNRTLLLVDPQWRDTSTTSFSPSEPWPPSHASARSSGR